MESPEPLIDARRCAVHAGEHATGTCARCGNFICDRCIDEEALGPERCLACRERVGSERMAWEHPEGSWAHRFWLTTKDLIARPTDTLERVQPGSIGMSLLYATANGAVQGVIFGVVFGGLLAALYASVGSEIELPPELAQGGLAEMLTSMLVGGLVGAPLFTACVIVGQAIARGLAYHLAVVVMRGDGGLGASLWVASYVSAIYMLGVPALLALAIPIAGPVLFALIVLAFEIWQAVHLTTAARRYHNLEGGRAAFAGWAPFLATVVTGVTCCVGYLGIVVMIVGAASP